MMPCRARFISDQWTALVGASMVGELHLWVWGWVGGTQEVSVPSSQFCCEPEAAKKKISK